MNIKGIIFDYGGTIDSNGVHWSHIIRDGYEHCGIEIPLALFRDAYVHAERALAKHPYIRPEHNFGELLYIKMKIEMEYLVEQGAMPNTLPARSVADYCYNEAREAITHARETLDALSQRYPMVLVSNFYGNIETVLKDFGLDTYLPTIIESAVVGVRKPNPVIFSMGVDALQLPAEDVVVVGDSYRKDIEPATKIGCQTIWIKGEGWDDSEKNIKHPHTITDFSELRNILL